MEQVGSGTGEQGEKLGSRTKEFAIKLTCPRSSVRLFDLAQLAGPWPVRSSLDPPIGRG